MIVERPSKNGVSFNKEHEYFFENCMDKEKDPTLARLLANPKFVLSGHQAFLTVDALEQMALISELSQMRSRFLKCISGW